MKKLFVLSLLLLMLAVAVSACHSAPEEPVETDTETSVETNLVSDPVVTEAPTEAETSPDPEAEQVLMVEQILSKNQPETMLGCSITSEMMLDIIAKVNGIETKMTMTGGVSLKQSENGMALKLTLPTMEPYSLILLDGTLYATSADGKYQCPLSEEDGATLWGELTESLPSLEDLENSMSGGLMEGGLGGSFGDGLLEILPTPDISDMLTNMKLTSLFAETEITVDELTGDTTVTFKGISSEVQAMINMMVGTMDAPQLEVISDMDMSLLLDMLATFDMDALTLSLTVDKDLILKACSVSFILDMVNAPDLMGDIPTTMVFTLSTVLDCGTHEISAPVDADTYEVVDWRTLFGLYTPEMLSLVPNENGVITLSEEPDLFALQYDYMMSHIEDFESVTLSLTAHVSDFAQNEDGSVYGTVFQVYEDGFAAYYPYLYVIIPAALADGQVLPEDDSTVKLTATLITDPDGELGYYDLLVSAYELISGPVAVG